MSELTVIYDLKDIPKFETEAEEAEFWDTHQLASGMMTKENAAAAEAMGLLPPTRPRPAQSKSGKSNPTSLRLGSDLEKRLRHLAELKGTSYQTLLKEFVLERVYEEEKRLHIIG